jgi:hypothetical protein
MTASSAEAARKAYPRLTAAAQGIRREAARSGGVKVRMSGWGKRGGLVWLWRNVWGATEWRKSGRCGFEILWSMQFTCAVGGGVTVVVGVFGELSGCELLGDNGKMM